MWCYLTTDGTSAGCAPVQRVLQNHDALPWKRRIAVDRFALISSANQSGVVEADTDALLQGRSCVNNLLDTISNLVSYVY